MTNKKRTLHIECDPEGSSTVDINGVDCLLDIFELMATGIMAISTDLCKNESFLNSGNCTGVDSKSTYDMACEYCANIIKTLCMSQYPSEFNFEEDITIPVMDKDTVNKLEKAIKPDLGLSSLCVDSFEHLLNDNNIHTEEDPNCET